MIKRMLIAKLFVLTIFLSTAVADRTPTVVSTVGMITDVVRNIGGEDVKVQGLIGAGVDPHLYKATRSDIAALTRADLVFYVGLFLEGKLVDALERLKRSGRRVVALGEAVDKQFLLAPPEFEGHFDPHIWMDPSAWKKVVSIISEELKKLKPEASERIEQRTEQYLRELDKLHAYCTQILKSVPEAGRVLLTAHDAFNYFGRRFGFEVLGIQGISTESEAGVLDIERLVKLIVERKVKAVFVESTVSERNIKALIAGAAAKGHTVKIGGELFSDAMGKEGTYKGTYIGMIDHNASTIAKALGGKVPAGGLNGKLELE